MQPLVGGGVTRRRLVGPDVGDAVTMGAPGGDAVTAGAGKAKFRSSRPLVP
jgi:hypothetical protein